MSRGTFRFHFEGITASALRASMSPISQSRVEGPVADHGPERKALEQVRHAREIVRRAAKDHEPHEVAECVHDGHDLAGQPAPGAADPLAAGPPFAPAAFQ